VVGATVRDVGVFPENESFIAGNEVDAGMTASVAPFENVATFELAAWPSVITATRQLFLLPLRPVLVNCN
jgi:hypothetical protein